MTCGDDSSFAQLRRPGGIFAGVLAVMATVIVGVGWPSPAACEVSDELADELRGYFKVLDQENADVQFARYLTMARIGDDAAIKELDEATTSDSTNRQLAARFGHVIAGKDEAMSPLVSVILKTSDLYELLRTRVTVLDDQTETELIEELLAEAEPVQRRDVFRYLAEQQGPLYQMLLDTLDDEQRRDEAVTALRHSMASHGMSAVADRQAADSKKVAEAAQSLIVDASDVPGRRSEMIPHLKKGLDSPHQPITIRAATRLLELNDRSGASTLIEMFFESEDPELRDRLADIMLEHGVSPSSERLKSLHTKLRATIKVQTSPAAKQKDKRSVDLDKIRTLADQVLRLRVASGDGAAFEQAVTWFRSTEFDRRLVAVSAFGYADNTSSKAVDLLSGALFEGREDMRMKAAQAIRTLESSKAIPALKRAVEKERSVKIKTEAIRALGDIGTSKALEILRLNTRVRQAEVKKAIIRAIRDVGEAEGATALRIFRSARNLQVQWEAYVATLALTPDKAAESLSDEVRNPVDGFMQDLLSLPPDTVHMIMPRLLRHPSTQVHEKAVSTIRKMGAKGMAFARDAWVDGAAPDYVRRNTLLMVSEYKASEDHARLISYIGDNPDGSLAARVAWTLTEYGGDDLDKTFRQYLPSPTKSSDGDGDSSDESEGDNGDNEGGEKEEPTLQSSDIQHPVMTAISAYGVATLAD
jgi:hypothetical protein